MGADVPPLVRDALDGETVRTRIELGGDDAVYVTPTRSLVYRSEGLLSDESVEEYSHEPDRVELKQGRRKSTFRLTYIDGAEEFSVPAARTEEVLEPLLEGVLSANGVTDGEERVDGVYRFSELTLIVTDNRVLKHVGSALWDEDFEAFPYADVTDLDTEEGSVATGLVVEVDGRPQRVKIPSDEARVVTRAIENAVLAYHDVSSVEELREKQGVADDGEEPAGDEFSEAGFDPLMSGAVEGDDAEEDDASGVPDDEAPDAGVEQDVVDRVSAAGDVGAGGEADSDAPAGDTAGSDAAGDVDPAAVERLEARLDALEAEVERQTDLLERQHDLVEQLVEELRRGR